VRLGVIRNPRSTADRRGGAESWDAVVRHPEIAGFAAPETTEALAMALSLFHERGIDCIAVSGGDGTVSEVLSAVFATNPGWRPKLAILRSGKTNLIAYDVGAARPGGAGALALADLAQSGLPMRAETRPVLRVEGGPGADVPRFGFFLGAGAFTRASDLAQVEAHAYGLNEGAAILWTLGSMVGRSLLGLGEKEPPAVLASCPADAPESGPRYLVIATTLNRLALGLNPFWGGGTGPLRYTDIAAPPRGLAAAIIPVLRGRPRRWMIEAGYRSGVTAALSLRLTARLTLDGEPFRPGPDGEVRITAADSVTFLAPTSP
jgi:hypothetical protein